jgi:hypothetical protein
MDKLEVMITYDTSTYIERLHYELRAHKNTIDTMLKKSKYGFEYSGEIYDKFMAEYTQINTEYEMALNELKKTFYNGPKDMDVKVKVYFDECKVEFIPLQEKGCCNVYQER